MNEKEFTISCNELTQTYYNNIAEMEKQLENEHLNNLTMEQLLAEQERLQREEEKAQIENQEPEKSDLQKLMVASAAIVALTDITTMTIAALGDSADKTLAKIGTPEENLVLNHALIDTMTNHCRVGEEKPGLYENMILKSHIIKGDKPEITSLDDVFIDKVRYCNVEDVHCFGLSDINDELKMVSPNASPYHEATVKEVVNAASVAKEYIIEPNNLTIEKCLDNDKRLELISKTEEIDMKEAANTIVNSENSIIKAMKNTEQNLKIEDDVKFSDFVEAMGMLAANHADMGADISFGSKTNMNKTPGIVKKADENVKENVYAQDADGETLKNTKKNNGLSLD